MIASLESLTSLLSNVLVGYIYKLTVSMNPSFAYFILAGVTVPMIFAVMYVHSFLSCHLLFGVKAISSVMPFIHAK